MKRGLAGRFLISLKFKGTQTIYCAYFRLMNTCPGVEPVPGAIFRLVSFLKRLKAAFEHEPVNKVSTKLFNQQNMKTHFLILFFCRFVSSTLKS